MPAVKKNFMDCPGCWPGSVLEYGGGAAGTEFDGESSSDAMQENSYIHGHHRSGDPVDYDILQDGSLVVQDVMSFGSEANCGLSFREETWASMERNEKKTILQRDENIGGSPWRTLCRW
jgi:hypothetical protein